MGGGWHGGGAGGKGEGDLSHHCALEDSICTQQVLNFGGGGRRVEGCVCVSALLPDTGLGPLFKPFTLSSSAQQVCFGGGWGRRGVLDIWGGGAV